MDAVEYLKQEGRMTKYCGPSAVCLECPLRNARIKNGERDCTDYRYNHPEEAVAIVEKWAKEHPVKIYKTYKSVFLEKFPDAELGCEDGTPYVCLYYVFGLKHAPDYCKWDSATCFKCWNREIEE